MSAIQARTEIEMRRPVTEATLSPCRPRCAGSARVVESKRGVLKSSVPGDARVLHHRLPRCAGCSRRSRKGSAARPRSKIAVNVRRLRRFIRSVVRGVPAVSLCSLSLFLSIIFLPFFSFYARRRLSRFIRSVARGASADARVVESTHGVLKSSVLGAESSSVPSADEACPLLASSLES